MRPFLSFTDLTEKYKTTAICFCITEWNNNRYRHEKNHYATNLKKPESKIKFKTKMNLKWVNATLYYCLQVHQRIILSVPFDLYTQNREGESTHNRVGFSFRPAHFL